MLVGLTGIGATRRSQSNIHNDVVNGWIKELYSCLSKLNPIQMRMVFNSNDGNWITDIQDKPGTLQITWPVEEGYTTGGVLSFAGAFTSFDFGSADIEGRVEGASVFMPNGKPTFTAGTHP